MFRIRQTLGREPVAEDLRAFQFETAFGGVTTVCEIADLFAATEEKICERSRGGYSEFGTFVPVLIPISWRSGPIPAFPVVWIWTATVNPMARQMP